MLGVKMPIITLINHLVAKEGFRFIQGQPSEECLKCRLKPVCLDKLKLNHLYEVVKVTNIKNPCRLYGYVTTVEVEERPITLVVPKRLALEGLKFTRKSIECNEVKCPYRSYCNIEYLKDNAPIKIVRVMDRVNCRASKESMVLVEAVLAD
ncbi:MAG: UPF0179 family protein [Desulfurococcaceae archaeon]|nr:UPF0179 family protein [Desulfurococcaceae archaeon]